MKKKESAKLEIAEEKLSGGALLKSVRQERGISLETVHDATKIPMDALRAIEEGYTVRTLTPFYIKGFLKIYAQYLDLEVSQVIEDYRSEKLPKYVKRDVHDFNVADFIGTKIDKKTKQKIIIGVAYLLCFFVIFKIITAFTHGKNESSESNNLVEEPMPDLIAQEEKKKQEELSKALKKQEELDKKEQKRLEELEKQRREELAEAARKKAQEAMDREAAVTPAVLPKQPEITTRIPVQNNMNNVTLTVRAKKNSWLRVSVDDQVVFQSTLRLGSVETWMAKDKIEISGKNINSLEFELNGKMIGSLGREDRKASKLVVTKDGLTVTQ